MYVYDIDIWNLNKKSSNINIVILWYYRERTDHININIVIFNESSKGNNWSNSINIMPYQESTW